MGTAYRLSKLFKPKNSRRLSVLFRLGAILATIFMLSGGIHSYTVFTEGAHSGTEARFALSGVFVFGFIFAGFMGLLYAYNNRDSSMCILGFVIVFFCYCSIELIGWIANGFLPWVR